MKFIIVNAFHRDDKGDAALLHVLVDQLRSIDESADIAVCSLEDPRQYPVFHGARNLGSFELYSSSHYHSRVAHLFAKPYLFFAMVMTGMSRGALAWLLLREPRRVFEECRSANLVVSVGGGYFITNRGWGSYMHLLFALQTLFLCKQIGIPVATAPVSVGPFKASPESHYVSWILKKLDLVLLREKISSKFFINKDGNMPSNVQFAVDSAFAFNPEGEYSLRKVMDAKEGEHIVALSVRNWLRSEQDAYEQSFADLIDHIAEKYPNMRPVFIPQCTFTTAEDDDREVAKKIITRSKSKNAFFIEADLDYKQVKLAYKEADFVVGTRFHAMVFCLAYGVPGIAIEYEHKTRGIMRDLNLEEWVIPIGSITSHHLIEKFGRLVDERSAFHLYLEDTMPAVAESASASSDLFKSLV